MKFKNILEKIGNFVYFVVFFLSLIGRGLIAVITIATLIYFLTEFEIEANINIIRIYALSVLAWAIIPCLEIFNFNKTHRKLKNKKDEI